MLKKRAPLVNNVILCIVSDVLRVTMAQSEIIVMVYTYINVINT